MATITSAGITRVFGDLSENGLAEVESASLLARLGGINGVDWDGLMPARRILIVSEAGVGKTFECRACQQRLWTRGEPAFFLELTTLAETDVAEMLSPEELERFNLWARAQSEIATFFLDSIDELRISQKSFEQALIRLRRAIAGQIGRARIFITTRPIPIDRQLIERHLPIPPPVDTAEATADSFAYIAMGGERKEKKGEAARLWRTVGLRPLTKEQIRLFAITQGVLDPDALLADIELRNAEEYAQRPQDLIELCSDWKNEHRIRNHAEQVAANVANKLKGRTDRLERASVPDERALEGVSRLALAMLLTRKLTIRYSAESDKVQGDGPALDANKVLTNWSQLERDTLLERALFGFANYARVRFHHRSVVEYLAAKRLDALLQRGVPVKAVNRMLFVETAQGDHVIRPSMRAAAAWLSLWHNGIFTDVLKRQPEVLLTYGDPQSLSPAQRRRALNAYSHRYAKGGWRGLEVPALQVHRFASPELDASVQQIWNGGVESPEVRELLCELIGAGKLTKCADIVHTALVDEKASQSDRVNALDALIALGDSRLRDISLSIEAEPARWPAPFTRSAILSLFPAHFGVKQLCAILQRTKSEKSSTGDFSWKLAQLINESNLTSEALNECRAGLTVLVIEDAEWRADQLPHARTKRADLVASLIVACNRQFREGVRAPDLLRSSVLAIRVTNEHQLDDEAMQELRMNLASAPATDREHAFWADDAFLESLSPARDSWDRLFRLSHLGGIHLDADKDRSWVIRSLADQSKSIAKREMMLWAAMTEVMPSSNDPARQLENLKQYIADAPTLVATIERRLKPPPEDEDTRRFKERSERDRRRREARDAKAHASWVNFWNEIAKNPDEVFKDSRAENTAWNLWQAMERLGNNSRAVGWNRRFIEQQFGRPVADRLRVTLQRMWRKEKPTLRSERPEGSKNTFLVRWQLGLAALYAEAEDPDWARKLTEEEATRASRFASIELNGFPAWLDALISAHPTAVDTTLGNELSLSLGEVVADSYAAIFVQNVRHASSHVVSLFTPRIKAWLNEVKDLKVEGNDSLKARIGQVVDLLLHSDSRATHNELRRIATLRLEDQRCGSADAQLWLPVLLQLSPDAGVATLEMLLKDVTPSERGPGVHWFATLFSRDYRGTSIDVRQFPPKLLLRLARLAYQYVRPADDAHHEGTYTPDVRDDAERGRAVILRALLATTGADGWAAKLEMATDPLFSHFKDRVIAVARERAAEEMDGAPATEADIVLLDAYGEVPPATRDAMFEIMRDRLDDIDDLLLQDESPRELWSKVRTERIMRRELARELRNRANHMYKIDQEGATADEKETDIRLRAKSSDQQAVIELKIGEMPRSATELRTTIKDQLLKKYMGPEECRAGCLLITLGSNKTWREPASQRKLGFAELLNFLNVEANRLSTELGAAVRLMVKGLDLRPRLTTERRETAKKMTSSHFC